ncbi:MAG: aminotransferase class V-fold PLP-dependent enzyme [Planctomycetes bacterium]|nr:aminotransferase class V-fold PLP-dependent enzyme [Planctomycetota bacterium]
MSDDDLLYLDHAATSWPKPQVVLDAMRRWYEQVGVSAERGDGERCQVARAEVAAARRGLGALCGLGGDRVAFVSGATEGLNLTLRALLRPGHRVLTTAFEHSSVVRPLAALRAPLGLSLEVLPPDPDGGLAATGMAAAIARHRPDVLVFTHASNVTGAVFDAAAFAAAARAAGCTSVLDVSQTAGWLPVDVGADVVVGSAHKALLGPPGLGFVIARPGVALAPQKQGGTGSSQALERHPEAWPTAFEAGTPNTPAIFGLAAALRWADAHPAPPRLAACLEEVERLADALGQLPGVQLLRPPPGPRTPVLSLTLADADPAELGLVLDAARIHVRSGHHCAPWLHQHLGTQASGTVRIAPGAPLGDRDRQRLVEAVASAAGG